MGSSLNGFLLDPQNGTEPLLFKKDSTRNPNWRSYPYDTSLWARIWGLMASTLIENLSLGVMTRGTLGDIDPLNKIPFMGARSRVKEGSL